MSDSKDTSQQKSPLEHLHRQWQAGSPAKKNKIHRLVSKRVKVTLAEARLQEQLVRDLRDALGLTQLYWSDVDRALWIIAQGMLSENLGKITTRLSPPENRDIEAASEFARQLAKVLSQLIRREQHQDMAE